MSQINIIPFNPIQPTNTISPLSPNTLNLYPNSNNISIIPSNINKSTTTITTLPTSKLDTESFPDLPNLKHLQIGILDSSLPGHICNNIETLIVEQFDAKQFDFSVFPNLKHLEVSSIYPLSFDINLDKFPNLEALLFGKNLRFKVSYTEPHENIKFLHVANVNFNIKSNYLPNLRSIQTEFEISGDILSCQNLEELKFGDFKNDTLDLSKFPKLKHLFIPNFKELPWSKAITFGDIMPELTALHVNDYSGVLDDVKFPGLDNFKVVSLTKHICIDHSKLGGLEILGDYGKGSVSIENTGNLKECNITSVDHVVFVGELLKLESLKCHVNVLSGNIVDLGKMEKLEKLELKGNYKLKNNGKMLRELSIDRVEYPTDLSGCSKLKDVTITGKFVTEKIIFGENVKKIKFELGVLDAGNVDWDEIDEKLDIGKCSEVEIVRE